MQATERDEADSSNRIQYSDPTPYMQASGRDFFASDFVGTKLFALVRSQNLLRASHTIKFYEDEVLGWCVIWS